MDIDNDAIDVDDDNDIDDDAVHVDIDDDAVLETSIENWMKLMLKSLYEEKNSVIRQFNCTIDSTVTILASNQMNIVDTQNKKLQVIFYLEDQTINANALSLFRSYSNLFLGNSFESLSLSNISER